MVDLSFLSIKCCQQAEGLCWSNPFFASTFALMEAICAGKSDEFTMCLRKGVGLKNTVSQNTVAHAMILEGVAVQGGVAATLSPVALQWGT